ncbi:DNA polymerase III subunit delta' [Xanthomonas oryzae]|uniref:DNA-directed DNA polymerase n=2 Tax=Xanthomonas oryzae TaxID=347 RepID=Q5H4I1_XANOR|nr:DNA polymerase III subunit delta' [Xanthomonas oryzae]AAW74140.1 DNA polymerase III delta' subunit [Xanthomonas oryzae pv. oryzae KACC 10331]AJQ84657.1 DNA polymerase III subunit delta' [Xanthomonas oryzae pv. oryzae PXO86]ALZ73267.1 DNA polymerase III subunit delta' [Xanthomonas oryzae pv. oryzae]AOS07894.1 DNA polymerase III subunit delta' [Xanthomonas oryzae pv. oryzae]AOS12075.1 DNA polymerase III subunit delta' [Xanthomonas oryzae pv. oryzae]
MTAAFAPWQQRAFDQTVAALDAGRLGHGLLICGPEGLGKRAVALALAEHVLASSPDPALAQRTRQLIAAGTHPDLQLISFVPNRTGDKLRTEIVIEQVREISQKLALTPHDGIAQVVIVDPADAINRSACNALLKTLEEPSPGRYLWLISAQPARLPATIRSRCQRLEFKLPPAHEALAWLLSQGVSERAAQEGLDAARGHPGLAAQWLREDGLAVRRAVAQDLEQIASGRAGAVDVAQRWTNDGQADQRLRHAADLVLAQASAGLTDPSRLHKLVTWFDAANRTRDLLRTTVRADLAVTELLLSWREGERQPRSRGTR